MFFLFILTEFEAVMGDTTYMRGKRVKKPGIQQQNKYVSHVDWQDQIPAYYPCHRKAIWWYKKTGTRIF
jgi:hypothetical protein